MNTRLCQVCQTPLIRKVYPSRVEAYLEFADRKFCGVPCFRKYCIDKKAAALHEKTAKQLVKAAKHKETAYRNYLRPRCVHCGWVLSSDHSCGYD